MLTLARAGDALCCRGPPDGRERWHRVAAICKRYVELALAEADFSRVTPLAIDETSRSRGHDYVTLAADAERRAVLFVTEGKEAATIERPAAELRAHGGDPEAIESVSIDMSPAFIKGCEAHLPKAQITFDKFHVIAPKPRGPWMSRGAGNNGMPRISRGCAQHC